MKTMIVVVGSAFLLLGNAMSVTAQSVASAQIGQARAEAPSQVILGTLPTTSAVRPPARPTPIPSPMTGTSAADYDAAKARAMQRGTAPSGELTAPPAVPITGTPGASRAFFPFDTAEESSCGSFIPADMGLAASPGFVVQVNNSCITVLDPVVGQISQANLSAFLSLPANDLVGDPRAIYDPNADRFIVIAEDFTPNPRLLLLAASQSGNPTLGWNIYSFNMGSAGQCGDFPTLGQTLQESGDPRGGIYTGFNTFNCSTGAFSGSTVFYLPKSPIYAGLGFSFNFAFNFTVGGIQVDTLQPANVWNATDRPRGEFMINSFDFNFGGGLCQTGCNGLAIWAVANGVPGPGQSTVTTGFVIGTANNYFLSPNAPQPGCTVVACLINTQTPNISGMVAYATGSLYPALTNNRGIQLFEVHPSLDDNAAITGAVIRNEVCFGCGGFTGGGQAFYPAIQPDSEGNFTMVFNFSAPDTFPGTAYLSRRVTQAENTVRDSGIFLTTGQGFYQQLDQFGRNRWGDYTAAAASYLNPPSYWFSGMFSEANGRWGTAIGLNGFTDPTQP